MLAIVQTGGKQYKVKQDSIIKVEKLAGELGETLSLNSVLMIADGKNIKVGRPTITGAVVEATVLNQMRDRKIIIFKKKRRHNYRRKKGHRQYLTVLKVTKIVAGK